MPKSEIWYFCETENKYFTDKTKLEECLRFQHQIKRRTPVHLRTVYHATPIGEPQHIELDVDGDKWKVGVRLSFFKTDEKGETYYSLSVVLDPDLKNMTNRINHNFPHLHITEKKLTELLTTAIKRGKYLERGRNQAIIYLTLNSWMQLKPKTEKSKLIYFSKSKLQSLIKNPEQSLLEAHRTAQPLR